LEEYRRGLDKGDEVMIFSPRITRAIQELTDALENEGFELKEIIVDEQIVLIAEIR
jgi:hypothetical protein